MKKNKLFLINGNILTMEPGMPESTWMVIGGGHIIGVGKGNSWKNFHKRDFQLLDLSGKTVVPGFIDTHCHLRSYAESFVTLDLSPKNRFTSISHIKNLIREYARDMSPDQWIRGRGYNEFYLKENRYLNRHDLDEAAPYNPVKLTHRTGHAHVLNSRALEIVGIHKKTPDPEGGLIERDLETGEPTGLLYEMGVYLSKRIPRLSDSEMEHGITKANEKLISYGIMSIHDVSSGNDHRIWKQMTDWKERGIFSPRISFSLGLEGFKQSQDNQRFIYGDDRELSVKGVKIILDETTGRLQPEQTELNQAVSEIHKKDMQVIIHAVEENGIEAACNAIENALVRFPKKNHRHRIEHCSLCPSDLAEKIAGLNIMVVTQPSFIYYNGERYLDTVPKEKQSYLYPIRSLIERGITVAASSDFPVVDPNPLKGIYAAMTRLSENGQEVGAGEGISFLEALKMYTINGAKATFEEESKGSIATGKLADLVVLDYDISKDLHNNMSAVMEDGIYMTIINGEIVWHRGQ